MSTPNEGQKIDTTEVTDDIVDLGGEIEAGPGDTQLQTREDIARIMLVQGGNENPTSQQIDAQMRLMFTDEAGNLPA